MEHCQSLLDFLEARDVAQVYKSQKEVLGEKVKLWNWLLKCLCQYISVPSRPPSDLHFVPLFFMFLRRLHAIRSYDVFECRFDPVRKGSRVHVVDESCLITNWSLQGGSILGNRICTPLGVSYWEVTGLSEGSYVGIVEELDFEDARRAGFHYGMIYKQVDVLLSIDAPACDHLPGIMYCEAGFITNGMFRGPKPCLPLGVNYLHAQHFHERDRVGIFVDLIEGSLKFLLNGKQQGISIPIDQSKKYLPAFSAYACYNLKIIPQVQPPWETVYNLDQEILEMGLHRLHLSEL